MNISNCPKCESENFILSGNVNGKQRYKCKVCSKHFSVAQKTGSITQELMSDILNDYLKTNLSISQIASERGVSRTILNRWFKSEYWKDKAFTKNPFKKISLNAYYVNDISIYFKFASPTIRVKPRTNDVKIQYLKQGYKTDSQLSVDLFTLSKFYLAEGEVFCTVKFNILSAVKNNLKLYNSSSEKSELIRNNQETYKEVFVEDFIDKDYLNKIKPLKVISSNTEQNKPRKEKIVMHVNNKSNFIFGISISDFLEYVLSNPNNFKLLLSLAKQEENNLVKYQERAILVQKNFEEEQKKLRITKIDEIRMKRSQKT